MDPAEMMPESLSARWWRQLAAPVDGAGLAVVRIVFGLVMAAAMGRFLVKGWVAAFYHEPEFHFHYAGLGWVRPLPPGWMEGLVAATGLAALALACGAATRWAAVVFTIGFTWLECSDVATYLNHYYLVSLLGLLFVLLPSGRELSCDAWLRRRRGLAAPPVRYGHYLVLRLQIAIVYTGAAIAKMQPDWLLEGLPLHLWLARHAEAPLIGGWLAEGWVALVASWAGMLYDLAIPWLLWWRRSRPLAFVLVVGFHVATWLLFPIGMFPWIMIGASLIFADPSWPRRVLGLRHRATTGTVAADNELSRSRPGERLIAAILVLHLLVQVLLPFRHLAHPGDVHWHEQGFRFSWRVMVMEKSGDLRYRLIGEDGTTRRLDPALLLAPHQVKQLETQPDLIVQFARELARREAAAGRRVAVHADCWVSLNGGPPRRLIEPDIDLARVNAGWDRSAYVTTR